VDKTGRRYDGGGRIFAVLEWFAIGMLFFGVLTPLGLVLRLIGRDPLKLGFDPRAPSYWITRTSPGGRQISMKKQF